MRRYVASTKVAQKASEEGAAAGSRRWMKEPNNFKHARSWRTEGDQIQTEENAPHSFRLVSPHAERHAVQRAQSETQLHQVRTGEKKEGDG